jgi:uncharacterized protein YfaS (alpha-2-macroglobulin family)
MPRKAVIEHVGSNQKYEVPLKWDAKDITESAWVVPKDAKSGVYRVLIEDSLGAEAQGGRRMRTSGSFRVEEFRVPLLRASIDPPAKPLVNADSVEVGIEVSFLAGGGASFLPVKLRSVVQPPGGFEIRFRRHHYARP